jgi:hypothetical protein
MEKYMGKYRIDSARLKNWDYGSAGYYFVTICTDERECFFGKIIETQDHLSEYQIKHPLFQHLNLIPLRLEQSPKNTGKKSRIIFLLLS